MLFVKSDLCLNDGEDLCPGGCCQPFAEGLGGRNLYLCAQVNAETHAVVDAGILLLSELLSTSQGYSLSKVALKKSR
jgi:hypothetical protein